MFVCLFIYIYLYIYTYISWHLMTWCWLPRSDWDLAETAPDADLARESWLFVPKDRWVQVPWTTSLAESDRTFLETSLPIIFLLRHDLFSQGFFEHFSNFVLLAVSCAKRTQDFKHDQHIRWTWLGQYLSLTPALSLNTFCFFLSSLLVIANEVWATFIHATVIFSGFFAPLRYVPWLKVPTWVPSQGHPSSTNFCCVPQNFIAANQMAIVSSNVLYYTFTRL